MFRASWGVISSSIPRYPQIAEAKRHIVQRVGLGDLVALTDCVLIVDTLHIYQRKPLCLAFGQTADRRGAMQQSEFA